MSRKRNRGGNNNKPLRAPHSFDYQSEKWLKPLRVHKTGLTCHLLLLGGLQDL